MTYTEENVHPAEIHRLDEHMGMTDRRVSVCEKTNAEMVAISARLTTLLEKHDAELERQNERLTVLEKRPVTLVDKLIMAAGSALVSAAITVLFNLILK